MTRRLEGMAHSPHGQRGVVLVMALIFLAVLLLTGTSATLNTSLEERMAGNTRNRDLAFQAAEAALRDAQSTLITWRTGTFNGNGGLLAYDPSHGNDSAYWGDISHWGSYRTPATSVDLVAQQPRYVIEKVQTVSGVEYYRVTARGVGGDRDANNNPITVVVLQALLTYTP